jgi:FlaA1/EpsC-like NDP-sugar epimerase
MSGKNPCHHSDGENVAPLLLLGAGERAKAALAAVRERPYSWIPVGVLDDDPALHGKDVDGVPVLGPVSLVYELPEAGLVACDPSLRERVFLPEERWVTLR